MARYNHMFDIAFTLENDIPPEATENISVDELIEALEKRVAYLKANPEEAQEAFGLCDSYEIEE